MRVLDISTDCIGIYYVFDLINADLIIRRLCEYMQAYVRLLCFPQHYWESAHASTLHALGRHCPKGSPDTLAPEVKM